MTFNSGANYILIGENDKPKTTIEYDKIPLVKEIILEIINEDFKFWTNKNLQQPGIERFNLLGKVVKKIKINSNVFDLAIDELEVEQKIIPFQEGSLKRFIKVNLNV